MIGFMGASKAEYFSEELNSISILAKALGHPARISIIEHLLSVDGCICNDIVDVLPLSQPTVSQHLRELRDAGFIEGEIEGNTICYCLNKDALLEMRGYLDRLIAGFPRE